MALPQGETLKGHLGPASFDGDGLAKVVRQAVHQAATPEQAEAALSDALSRAGTERVPLSAGHLTAFVLGPLFEAVVEQINEHAAERVVSILKPVLRKKSELELGSLKPEEKPRPTVLIVDDDIVVRAQLLSILNARGFNAISAPDQNVALAMSVRCRPDLIISDMSMGRVRGNQLAALLRVAFHEAAPPIIILTEEDPLSGNDGGVCMLTKPIDRVTLLNTIEPLMERCSQATGATRLLGSLPLEQGVEAAVDQIGARSGPLWVRALSRGSAPLRLYRRCTSQCVLPVCESTARTPGRSRYLPPAHP